MLYEKVNIGQVNPAVPTFG